MTLMRKTSLEYNKTIHTKARSIIERNMLMREFLRDCADAEICPKCGEEGLAMSIDEHDLLDYSCDKCKWRLTE